MTISLTYSDDLSRVTISLSGLTQTAVRIERSINQLLWEPVRGGLALPVVAGSASLIDYEFVPDTLNYYRVRDADPLSDPVIESDSITPDLNGQIWLKSVQYPFLNRPVNVGPVDSIIREFRGEVFDVSGRSFPVGVTDIRGARRFTLSLITNTLVQERNMDLILATNEIMLVQTPVEDAEDCAPVTMVPGGYVVIETTVQRQAMPGSRVFLWSLPCRIVAAPGPDVIPTTMVWGTVFALFGSWGPLIASNPTWGDLLATVGDPDDLVVL